MQGSNDTFAKLVEWVQKNDTNTDEAYPQVIGSIIDIQNYIEYTAIQMYTGNTDTLNVKRYRNSNEMANGDGCCSISTGLSMRIPIRCAVGSPQAAWAMDCARTIRCSSPV